MRLTPEELRTISNDYVAGFSLQEIGDKLARPATTILQALTRQNIRSRTFAESKNNDRIVAEAVKSGTRVRDAAALVGYTEEGGRAAVNRFLGFKDRSSASHQKYGFDENFFDDVDHPDKAYWLGFLFADGTVIRNDISLRLASKDREHVEEFKRALSANHPVGTYWATVRGKKYKYARLVVSSPHMCQSLAAYGCFQNKTTRTKLLRALPPELERHFWRGVTDGDGSLVLCNNKWALGAVGSREILEAFKSFSLQHVASDAEVCPHKSICVLRWSSTKAQAMARILYVDAPTALPRKRALAEQLMRADIRERHDKVA